METELAWWQRGVIYQVVVPSFADTDGDGLGDLGGIIEQLDYLQWLGVGGVWLSPIYPSPLEELGYDVSDYCNVHPKLGTLGDFDKLVDQAHARQIKIILDYVANHTCDQHPWFKESRLSRSSPKRDWYIWADGGRDGSPPNNWLSVFGGSVWQRDEATGQYYCHSFLPSQPDLNWRNPEVQAAMLDVLRFWLERDADGFRIDATCLMIKDERLRDNPPNPSFQQGDAPDNKLLPRYTRDQPELHQVLSKMRQVVERYGDDRVLVGELYLPVEKLASYYGNQQPELHLPLNLKLAWTPWSASKIEETIDEYQRHLPRNRWPTWTISTHDCFRVAMRSSPAQARVGALLLLTLPGTVTLYYGEELGMQGVDIPADRAKDPQGRRTGRNRDPERTPMQWDDSEQAGFTTGKPWLPVGADKGWANVAVQRHENPRSLLHLYRKLIDLRHSEPALVHGRCEQLHRQNDLLIYDRCHDKRHFRVVLNFGGNQQQMQLDKDTLWCVALSTLLDRQGEQLREYVDARGDEALLLEKL